MVSKPRDSIYVLAILVCVGFIYHMLFKIHETERKIMKMQADEKKKKFEFNEFEENRIFDEYEKLEDSNQTLTELTELEPPIEPDHGRYVYHAPSPPRLPDFEKPDFSIISSSSTKIVTRYTAEFIIFILTRREAFETRKVIRDTWAKGHKNVLFLVGKGCPYPKAILNPKDKLGCELDPKLDRNETLARYSAQIKQTMARQKDITEKISIEKQIIH